MSRAENTGRHKSTNDGYNRYAMCTFRDCRHQHLRTAVKNETENWFIIVITDWYIKLTRGFTVQKAAEPHVAMAVLENWIWPCGIPNATMIDKDPQFLSEFFAAMCALVGTKPVTTTEYCLQANGRVDWLNRMLIACLRHYISEHQSNQGMYVQLLTDAYNTHVHRTCDTSPFSLVLSWEPTGALVSEKTRIPEEHSTAAPVQAELKVLKNLTTLKRRVEDSSQKARVLYKRYFNKKVGQLAKLRRKTGSI